MKNIIFLLVIVATLISCKKDPKVGDIRLVMNHNVAGANFVLDEMNYTSPASHDYEVTKLWYYISEVSFLSEDGSKHTVSGGHLTKLEDATTFNHTLNNIEPGTYNKIQFQFGISKELNKDAYLENTQDNQNMAWPVQMEAEGEKGAYHYMKFEGRYDSLNTGKMKNFIMHSGPTHGADNSFSVTLNLNDLKVDGNSHEIHLEMDLQEWLQNPTLYDYRFYSMVMMNQNTQDIYKANGQSVFSLGDIFLDAE